MVFSRAVCWHAQKCSKPICALEEIILTQMLEHSFILSQGLVEDDCWVSSSQVESAGPISLDTVHTAGPQTWWCWNTVAQQKVVSLTGLAWWGALACLAAWAAGMSPYKILISSQAAFVRDWAQSMNFWDRPSAFLCWTSSQCFTWNEKSWQWN